MNRLQRGLVAGAVGTIALEIATYMDMTNRGRPSSELPAQAANALVERVGVSLGDGEKAENRKSGLGALLGYGTGITIGGLCGLVVGKHRIPALKGGVIIGAIAMAGADGPLVALKLTDPRKWEKADWLADALPHLIYGLVAITFGAFNKSSSPRL